MIPVPRVSVKNSERYPSRPRAGSLKRIRTVPTPGFFMSSRVARRGPSFSITTPRYPSGQSTISSSYGSSCSPFGPSRGMMRGRLTWNSYPSRRIVSISTPRGSSPRPDTVHAWGPAASAPPRPPPLPLHPLHPPEPAQRDHARLLVCAVPQGTGRAQRQHRDGVADPHPAPLDPPDRDPPQIRRIVQGRDEHLQRPVHVRLGR